LAHENRCAQNITATPRLQALCRSLDSPLPNLIFVHDEPDQDDIKNCDGDEGEGRREGVLVHLVNRKQRKNDCGDGINPKDVFNEADSEESLHEPVREEDERPDRLWGVRETVKRLSDKFPNDIPRRFGELISRKEKGYSQKRRIIVEIEKHAEDELGDADEAFNDQTDPKEAAIDFF
jgi:hypothetical protein